MGHRSKIEHTLAIQRTEMDYASHYGFTFIDGRWYNYPVYMHPYNIVTDLSE